MAKDDSKLLLKCKIETKTKIMIKIKDCFLKHARLRNLDTADTFASNLE